MPCLCRYSKKVADEFPCTLAVPDDLHTNALPPNSPQMMPKIPPKTSYLRPPERILKVWELCAYLRCSFQTSPGSMYIS